MSAINYTDYADFLQQKLVIDGPSGFEPGEITPLAFDFQREVMIEAETSQIDLFSEAK